MNIILKVLLFFEFDHSVGKYIKFVLRVVQKEKSLGHKVLFYIFIVSKCHKKTKTNPPFVSY